MELRSASLRQELESDLLSLEAIANKLANRLKATDRDYDLSYERAAGARLVIAELEFAAELARLAIDMCKGEAELARARDVVIEQLQQARQTLHYAWADLACPTMGARN